MSIAYLLCVVLTVSDGDTVRLQCKSPKAPFSLRLTPEDAPEIAHKGLRPPIALQPYGPESAANLALLCAKGSTVRVARIGYDRFRRAIGRVKCGGKDAGTEQVRAGFAWVWPAYAKKNDPLFKIQATAQAKRLGLWKDLDTATPPVQPWVWRGDKP